MGKGSKFLLCLLCLLCLCLAACGEKKPVHRIEWQTAPAYLSEDVALPVEICALNGSCTDGESIYYLTKTRAEGERGVQLCGSMRRAGGGAVDHSYSPGFSVNRADFEEAMAPRWLANKRGEYVLDRDGQRIQEPKDVFYLPVEGQTVSGPLDGGRMEQIRAAMVVLALAPTEPQMENFWNLYNAIDHIYTEDMWDLYQIIREPAEAYFAGDKSLDETAALIQSRASIYVGEQR